MATIKEKPTKPIPDASSSVTLKGLCLSPQIVIPKETGDCHDNSKEPFINQDISEAVPDLLAQASNADSLDIEQPPTIPSSPVSPVCQTPPGQQFLTNQQPAASQNVQQKPITLRSLKKKQLDRICHELDGCTTGNVPRWQILVEEEYKGQENIPKRKRIVGDLEQCSLGGGNPGRSFLEKLETNNPDLNCEDFRKVAVSFHRGDINKAPYLQNDGKLSDLEFDDILALSVLLNNKNASNWEYFAEEYGFTSPSIEQIRNSKAEDGTKSAGLKLLKDTFGDMSTTRFIELCKSKDLNFIAKTVTQNENESRKE